MKHYICILLAILLFNCKEEQKPLSAKEVIDQSIKVSGGERFDNSLIKFDFRGINYKSTLTSEAQVLSRRIFKDNGDTIVDFLRGSLFQRYINEVPVQLPDSMKIKYSASVNSVHYFSILPYRLNDIAVNKESLEAVTINGKNYHKIKVTFSEEDGGEDFEDVFVYWVNKDSFKVEYLAYSYDESDGKGLRFREAYNERFINGFRFVDYNNYKPENDNANLFDLDKAFEAGELKLLSKIELKNIEASQLPTDD